MRKFLILIRLMDLQSRYEINAVIDSGDQF